MKYIILCGGIKTEKDYSLPSPLNYIHGKYMIEYIIDNIPSNEIYIFYNIFLEEYNFEEIVLNLFKTKTIHFSKIDYLTRGPVESALIGLPELGNEPILFIDDDNVHNIPKLDDYCHNFIGYGSDILGEGFSFIQIENKLVTRIEEKVKISDNYCCGIYGFKSANIFKKYARILIEENIKVNHSFYFSQVYKLMLDNSVEVHSMYINYSKFIGNNELQNELQAKKLRICFDLDNTLVTYPTVPNDYSTVKPIFKMIYLLKNLKKVGHEIIIYTSRGLERGHKINEHALITLQTLDKYNIEYDEIIFGKPHADIYIDDKAINPYCQDITYFGIDMDKTEFIHNKVDNNKFNVIKKQDDVIKKYGPYSILKGELFYYQNIPESITYFPKLLNFNKKEDELELTMEYIKGIPLFYLYKNSLLDEKNINCLFSILEEIHTIHIPIHINEINIHNNYFKKIRDRFNVVDYSFENAKEYVEIILEDLSRNFFPEIVGMIHGDFWFSNIILDYRDNYKLIDMKGQVDGQLTLNGDRYYDYGKLYQSILGYDLVLNGCVLDRDYLNRMRLLFLEKCKKIGLNIGYLEAVTKCLMVGTIYFIENFETKKRIWDFIFSFAFE
jgi:capsule biosynthesis phosphatase